MNCVSRLQCAFRAFRIILTCALMIFTTHTLMALPTVSILANFNAQTGGIPQTGLTLGSDGNFYGTTSYSPDSSTAGSVFKITPNGTLTVLTNFYNNADNGITPYGTLVQYTNGDLYGTTIGGGSFGAGTVFKITTNGSLTTLFVFDPNNGGSYPATGLVQGDDGNFYGTTSNDPTNGLGTIFRMTPAGDLTNLFYFPDSPGGQLVKGTNGNFYSTTSGGGTSFAGSIFMVTTNGTVTTLASFDGSNGANPVATLVQDTNGNFYGTTSSGGSFNKGTAFRMTPSGTLTILVSFTGTDGYHGELVPGTDGNFYGATSFGINDLQSGLKDAIYQMTPSGTLTTLATFETNSYIPVGKLVFGLDGNLYGMMAHGGSNDLGTIFKFGLSAPDIGVQYPEGVNLTSGSATIDFNHVEPFHSSYTATIIITNDGFSTLSSLAVSVTGSNPGDYDVQTVSSSVAPTTATVIFVTFRPTSTDSNIAVLHITSNDTAHSPFDINLVGNTVGTADPAFINSSIDGIITSQAIQADGKILISGSINGLIARLNADGTQDTSFQPNPDGAVNAIVVQPDGKIVIGGSFTQVQPAGDVSPTIRYGIARLNADGTVDTGFDPNTGTSSFVNCLALQPDGSILLGGSFTSLQPNGAGGPTTRNNIARVYADGSLDTLFDPNANNGVNCIVVQPDGNILIGGSFTTLTPNGAASATVRNRIARVDAYASVDAGFDPDVNGTVQVLVLQPDGAIIAGGSFSAAQPNGAPSSTSRLRMARFLADGSLDTGFDPAANSTILSAVLQTDGKVIIGGTFTSLQPNGAPSSTSRHRIARLNSDGSLDASFDPNPDNVVNAVSLQADGRIIVAGRFAHIGGIAESFIARLDNDGATQSLTVDNSSHIQWLRGGSSPEVNAVTFDYSPDGVFWNPLGSPITRMAGGWSTTPGTLPSFGIIRATGTIFGGQRNGSSGLVQTTNYYSITPPNHAPTGMDAFLTMDENSSYTFSPGDFGFSDPLDFPPNHLNRVKITTLPNAGTLTVNAAPVNAGDFVGLTDVLVYTPGTGDFGLDYASFTFQVEDDGGTANGGVNLDMFPKTIQLDVNSIVTGTAPGIAAQSSSQTANAGTNVILTVTATGTAPLSYFWQKNGGNLVGANTDTLTLANVLRTNAGTYTVVITNAAGGVTSAPVIVTILDPAIVQQPTNLVVASGASAQFEADAAGTATNRFQWYCVSNDVAHTTVKLTGKTNNILLLTAVKTNNVGGYFAIVTNQLAAPNSATSVVAQLTVAALPTFTTLPTNLTVVAGNKAAFSVVVSAATTLPVYYQWAENGHSITGATNASLTIAHATEVGNNYYNCTVTNIGGSATSTTNAHGRLTVTVDATKPVVGMTYPASSQRFTNNVVYHYLSSSLTASNVLFLGTVTDNGWITNVTIKQTFPTTGVPVSATLVQSVPGNAVYSNAVVLVDGTNTFTVTAQDAGGNSNSVTRSVYFLHPAILTVQTNGYGTTAPMGATTYGSATNNAPLEPGRTFSIKATPAPGNVLSNWTDGAGHFLTNTAQLNFTMATGLVLNANFVTNPILAGHLAGAYNGLFYETNGLDVPNVKMQSAGFVGNLIVTTNRTFTGALTVQGATYTIATNFDLGGNRTFTILRTAQGRTPLTATWHLDVVGATKQITGTVASLADGWTANLVADLAVYNAGHPYPGPGHFTLQLDPPDASAITAPGGYGFGRITNTTLGKLIFDGRAADGSYLSQNVPISKDGNVPLFVKLYNNSGLLTGALHMDATTLTGDVTWLKPATSNPITYVTGFTNVIAAHGEVFTPPTGGATAFGTHTNLVLELFDTEGFSTAPGGGYLSWNVQLKGNTFVVVKASSATNALTAQLNGAPVVELNPLNGTVLLNFKPTTGPGVKSLSGIISQQGNSANGYLIGTTNIGSFSLHP